MAKQPNWTPEQERLLRQTYGKYPTREVMRLLGRSRRGVVVHAHKLGIKKGRIGMEPHQGFGCACETSTGRCWKPEQVAIMELEYGFTHVDKLARRLGRSRTSIYLQARKMGITVESQRRDAEEAA